MATALQQRLTSSAARTTSNVGAEQVSPAGRVVAVPFKVPGTRKITVLRSFCHVWPKGVRRAILCRMAWVEKVWRWKTLACQDCPVNSLGFSHAGAEQGGAQRVQGQTEGPAACACIPGMQPRQAICSRKETWVYPDTAGVRAADIRLLNLEFGAAEDEEAEPVPFGAQSCKPPMGRTT